MRRTRDEGRRPAVHLYRDRRRRLRRMRLLRFGAILLAALLAILLAVVLFKKRPAPIPTPEPHPTPEAIEVPAEPTPGSTAEPTPENTPEPRATELPYNGVYAPAEHARVATEDELIDLYWWMIETGHPTVYLEALEVPLGDVSDITDKFSNYFDKYRAIYDPPAVRVEFKPGLRALHAFEGGNLDSLDEDAREVADKALAVVDELVRDGMTAWEKELVLHDYVVDHCDYALNPFAPHNGDSLGFFRYGAVGCAGYCDIFRLLGKLAGLEVEMIGGPTTRDPSGSKGHAWCLVRLNGLWYVVDPAWDDPIEDEPTLEHTFFNVPFSAFGETRRWNEAYLPDGDLAVTLDEQYYYNRPEYQADSRDAAVEAAVRQLDESGRAYLMVDGDLAKSVSQALAQRYGKKGSCAEMSEDLSFNLFRYRF